MRIHETGQRWTAAKPGTEPVLALLPFAVQSGSDGDELIAQGLLEDICGELTRFPALQVISWMSGRAVADLPDPEVGARLGATHVLRGRVRRTGARLRVSATLVESQGSTQLWTEQFDAAAEEIFTIQDEIVARIAVILIARLEERALRVARRKPTDQLAAYEACLRGLMLLREGTLEADEGARPLFRHALDLDPLYARAHGGLSLSYFNEWSCQFWDRFEENGRQAYTHAHRALDLDDRDPMLHLIIGRIQLYNRAFDHASWYFDRALALCPNDAETLIQLSLCEVYLGRPDASIRHAEKAMRLNPYHPDYYHAYAALAHFAARDFDRTLAVGSNIGTPPMIDIPAYTAIALAHLGRMEEARQELARYHAVFEEKITYGRQPQPGEACQWLIAVTPFKRKEDETFLLEGFQLLDAVTEQAAQPRTPFAADVEQGTFVRQGEGWVLEFRDQKAIIGDMKGLHDIGRLLARSGDEIHCLDLADRADHGYGGDEVLDSAARQSLKARIRDLQEELGEAEDNNDLGRAEQARQELDQLVETLSAALGLGGRQRRIGNLSERTRTTVTWRIRHAVRKLREVHEPLARHLENSLRTGTFCAYKPEHPVRWRMS
ncbi:MAG: hypothetical protein WED00_09830 [Aquisalimonadaceae bacterium]